MRIAADVFEALCPGRLPGRAGELLGLLQLYPDDLSLWEELRSELNTTTSSWSRLPGDSKRENVVFLASAVILRGSFDGGVQLITAAGDLLDEA